MTSVNPPYTNCHLKSADIANRRSLSIAGSGSLWIVGLDAFVIIRFLRFEFDVMLYPFLCTGVFLFPMIY